MITIGLDYKVADGKQNAFIDMFNQVQRILMNVRGHRNSTLYRDVSDSKAFLIVSEWADEDHFQAFIESCISTQVAS